MTQEEPEELINLKEYPVIEMDIDDIKIDPTNPNVMTLEQERGLEKSMMNFGRLKYVVIDQNNFLIDGAHRVKIEKALGTKTLKVIQVTVKDEIDRKMMRETLNQLHGEYDPKKQSDELLDIYQANRLEDLGLILATPIADFQDLIHNYHPDIIFPEQRQYEPESDEKITEILTTTQTIVEDNEVWQLGKHILINGDSTDTEVISNLLYHIRKYKIADNKVNLVFTDPPYNIGFKYHDHKDTMTNKDYDSFCNKWFINVTTIIRPDILAFTPGPRNVGIYENILKWDDIGVWYKNNSRSGASLFYFRRCEPILFYGDMSKINKDKKRTDDFFDYSMPNFAELNKIEEQNSVGDSHAPAKNIELVKDIINHYSNPNDIVVDTFLGTGTTLIASEQTNRVCFGIEYDKNYCSVILERYYQLTRDDPISLTKQGKTYSQIKQELRAPK